MYDSTRLVVLKWRFYRVVLTPHVAGVTELSYRAMAKVVAQEARRLHNGLPPTIQLAAVPNARTGGAVQAPASRFP